MRKFITQIREVMEGLSEEAAVYILAAILTIFFIIGHWAIPQTVPKSFLYIPSIILAIAFIAFIYKSTANLWTTSLSKLLLAALTMAFSTVSIGFAKQMINFEFGVPSSAFPLTTSLLSIFVFPLIAALAIAIIGTIGFAFSIFLFFSPFEVSQVTAKRILLLNVPQRKLKTSTVALNLTRYIGMIALVSFAFNFLSDNRWYSNQASLLAMQFAHHFEAEGYTYCQITEGSKVVYLNTDLIIVSTILSDGSYSFKTKDCIKNNQK